MEREIEGRVTSVHECPKTVEGEGSVVQDRKSSWFVDGGDEGDRPEGPRGTRTNPILLLMSLTLRRSGTGGKETGLVCRGQCRRVD